MHGEGVETLPAAAAAADAALMELPASHVYQDVSRPYVQVVLTLLVQVRAPLCRTCASCRCDG